jgi:hypothetical protein
VPPPGQNFEHHYLDSFEEAKKELGLTGQPFDYFWQDIAQVLDEQPFNVYAKEVPDIPGLWAYPTEPKHPDFVACLVLYSVEDDAERINYFGLAAVKDGRLVVPKDL